MSFHLSIGATASLLSPLSSEHLQPAQAGPAVAGPLDSYDDGNWCGTVPRKFPQPPPPPPLGSIGGNIADALHNLPGIGGNVGDAFHDLPPIGGNVADVLRGALGGVDRMHV